MAYFPVTIEQILLYDRLHAGSMMDGKTLYSFNLMGARTSWVDTTSLQDIGEFLGGSVLFFPEPTGAQSFEVVSSSTSDTSAGTGTRTVHIHYLDNNWLPQNTTATLNGTTPVAVAALTNCQAINWMHSATVGSGGVAAGNILLRIASAGATHEQITAGGNMSLSARYTVPDGFYGVIHTGRSVGLGTAHTLNSMLRATCERDTRDLISGVYLFQDKLFTNDVATEQLITSLVFKPRVRIKVSAIPSNVGTDASTVIPFMLKEI